MMSVFAMGRRAVPGRMPLALLLMGACGTSDDGTATDTRPTTTTVAGTGATGVAGTGVAGTGPRAGTGVTPVAGTGGGTGLAGRFAAAGTGVPTGTAGSIGSAGTGPVATAGTGGAAAGTGPAGAGGAAPAAGTGGLPPTTGPGPVLPEIQGECPAFMNGSTIMAGGHRGVLILSGEAGKGGPLLFYWHGTGGSAQEAMRTLPAGVRNEIISQGGIIASFNGNQSSGTGRDCSGTGAHNMADFAAADVIAACAVKNHGIDPHRIYTTGCSAGGLQSGCMAEMRSSYIAAAAPNSGGVVSNQPWQDKHSPAILTMHGGSGDMVVVTFSQTSATLDMAAKTHGSFVVNCNHGGGHCQAPAALQSTAWQFMKDHPWGFTDSPWKTAFPAGTPDYCKIF